MTNIDQRELYDIHSFLPSSIFILVRRLASEILGRRISKGMKTISIMILMGQISMYVTTFINNQSYLPTHNTGFPLSRWILGGL